MEMAPTKITNFIWKNMKMPSESHLATAVFGVFNCCLFL